MANNEIKVSVVFATAGAQKNVKEFTGKLKEMEQKTGKATAATGKQFGALDSSVKKFLKRFALTAVVSGTVVAGFNRSIQKGKEFQTSLADLEAITGISGDQLDQLAGNALDLSVKYGESASQIIEANKLVASQLAAKIDFGTEEGLRELQEVSEQAVVLQKAAGIDLPTAVGTLTTAVNQFNLPASETNRLIQSIAAGSKFGAAEVRDQSEAYRESGSVAAAANLEFEELNGAVQVLAANAIKGSQAGTNMRNVILTLNNPAKLAAEGIEGVNLQSDGLSGSLEKLKPLLEDSAALEKLFGRESITTAQILIQNAAGVEEMTKQVTGSNVATEQLAVNMNTFEAAQSRLTQAMDKELITAFQETNGLMVEGIDLLTVFVGVMGDGVRGLNAMTQEFNRMNDAVGTFENLIDKYTDFILPLRIVKSLLETTGVIESSEKYEELFETIDDGTTKLEALINNVTLEAEEFAKLRGELDESNPKYESFNRLIEKNRQELEAGRSQFESYIDVLKTQREEVEEGTFEYAELSEKLNQAENGLSLIEDKLKVVTGLTQQNTEAADNSSESTEDQTEAATGLSDQIKALKEEYEELLNLPSIDAASIARMQQLTSEIMANEQILELRERMSEVDPTEKRGIPEDDRFKDLMERMKQGWMEYADVAEDSNEKVTESGIKASTVLESAFVNGINTAIDQMVRDLIFAEGKMLDLQQLGKNLFSGILSGLAKYGLVAATGGTGSVFASILGFADGGLIPGYSSGGQIHGPGTGRSDSVLLRGSRGEYMLNQKSTAALGPHRADKINRNPHVAKAVGSFVDDLGAGGSGQGFRSDYRPPSVTVQGADNSRAVVEKLDELSGKMDRMKAVVEWDWNQFERGQNSFKEKENIIGRE